LSRWGSVASTSRRPGVWSVSWQAWIRVIRARRSDLAPRRPENLVYRWSPAGRGLLPIPGVPTEPTQKERGQHGPSEQDQDRGDRRYPQLRNGRDLGTLVTACEEVIAEVGAARHIDGRHHRTVGNDVRQPLGHDRQRDEEPT